QEEALVNSVLADCRADTARTEQLRADSMTQVAVQEKNRAEQRNKELQSSGFAAVALGLKTEHPTLGLHLASRSYGLVETPSYESLQSLLSIYGNLREYPYAEKKWPGRCSFLADGTILCLNNSGGATVFDRKGNKLRDFKGLSHRVIEACVAQDCQLIYVDQAHSESGSGVAAYALSSDRLEVNTPIPEWDPASRSISAEQVEVVTGRDGNTTIYEWRIQLNGPLSAYTSIGFDHFLIDFDAEEDTPYHAIWGPSFGKTANPHHLGDLILIDTDTKMGELTGVVRWNADIKQPRPSKVRIRSTQHKRLWVDVPVGEKGRYIARLPAGNYRVSSALRLTRPFQEDFANFPVQINPTSSVAVDVTTDGISTAKPLILDVFERPGYLFEAKGVLGTIGKTGPQAVDTFVDAFRRYYNIPGVSYAIVENGQVVHSNVFGVKNTLTQAPVMPDTLFEGASTTKPMFALAAMNMATRGEIDLDRPLLTYLPFPNIAGDPNAYIMTARHVLTHRSGLPNWAWGGPGTWEGGGNLNLDFTPGQQFQYSGEAFNYLGRVLEKLSGKPLDQIMQEEVLGPMQLTNTYFALDAEQAKHASLGHMQHFPVWRSRADFVSPASSVHSSAVDFAKFLIALTNNKQHDRAVFEALFKPYFDIPKAERVYDDDWQQSMGLGFFLKETPLGRFVEHGGNNGDFDCKFSINPDTGMGYVIFTNNNVGDELNLAFEQYLLYGRDYVVQNGKQVQNP
ncbi:MAG: serine hydrolase domain-containing protein, partial [Pseudomonadota bacterium]